MHQTWNWIPPYRTSYWYWIPNIIKLWCVVAEKTLTNKESVCDSTQVIPQLYSSPETGGRHGSVWALHSTIWDHILKLHTKFYDPVTSGCWEKCGNKKCDGRNDGRTDGMTDKGKTVYPPLLRSGGIIILHGPVKTQQVPDMVYHFLSNYNNNL